MEGAKAPALLRAKIASLGPRRALFAGAAGAAGAHAASFWPWFTVHNALQQRVPRPQQQEGAAGLGAFALRAAGIGLAASVVSDAASNALHVLKTRKQTAATAVSYAQTFRAAAAGGGVLRGVFLRGLGTKVCASAANGVLFSVLWNAAEERMAAPPDVHA